MARMLILLLMSEALSQKLFGRFIVLDGPDGSGKSTQIRLLADSVTQAGVQCVSVRDPGGTAIGDRIRHILLDRDSQEMSVECELMLYMASRAQLVSQIIRPSMEQGKCVLSDRYISSTIAYQGAGGMAAAAVRTVADVAVGGLLPDLTIILDMDPEKAFGRITGRADQAGPVLDRMEMKALSFHKKVREMFLEQARQAPDTFAVVDASADVEKVHSSVMKALEAWRPASR